MAVPHPDPLSGAGYSAVELAPDDTTVYLLDQRRLPAVEEYHALRTVEEVARAIREMVVRGAPAIGISAAYGLVLAARAGMDLAQAGGLLKATRPTAVNLSWAVDTLLAAAASQPGATAELLSTLGRKIHREDVAACREIGRLGAARIPEGARVLTHCNAGALATGGYGTALGVIRAAHEAGKSISVFADETRPYLQGARLTAWELQQLGVPVTVVADVSAGHLLSRGEVDLAVVGSDRIAANGDVANKIGTYTVAALCQLHERPFYVAAPWSTVDERCPSGDAIPIEERPAAEVTHLGSVALCPRGVGIRNPAFDVTPARFVSAIFTERGVIDPVGAEGLRALARATTAF